MRLFFRAGVRRAPIFGWAHEARVWLGDEAMLLLLGGGTLGSTWLVMCRRDAVLLDTRPRGRGGAGVSKVSNSSVGSRTVEPA